MTNEEMIGASDLEKVSSALTEYSRVDAGLAELRAKYGTVVYEVATTAGMKAACEARRAIREPRYKVEEIRKAAKAPLLALGRQVDSEAKRITAALLELERPIDTQINTEECRKEVEKRAKEEAERVRVGEIQRRLGKIRALPEAYTSAVDPARLAEVIGQLEGGLTFDYQEFTQEAETARQAALVVLRRAHVDALERIERQQAEERERAEAEERQRQEHARLEAERAERERADAKHRAAEEARIAEERRRLDAEHEERRRQAEEQRKEQERIATIRQWITALNGPTHLTANHSPALIEQAVNTLLGAVVDERYGEFHTEAAEAREAGIQRLRGLLEAAQALRAESDRIASERVELERQQREQAARQAEIERQEREAREAEERRQAAARAEEERRAEAARRRASVRKRISSFTAADIVDHVVAAMLDSEVGTWSLQDFEASKVAERIAEIPHADWVAIAASDEQEVAA